MTEITMLRKRDFSKKCSVCAAVAMVLSSCGTANVTGTAEPPVTAVVRPIPSGEGYYVSPFKADGSLADWVTKARQSPPTDSDLTSSRQLSVLVAPWAVEPLGDKLRQKNILDSLGGWHEIRAGAELSFNSVNDFRTYLNTFKGKGNFASGWCAAAGLYPELGTCGQAYSR